MLLQDKNAKPQTIAGESAIPDVGVVTELLNPINSFSEVLELIKSQVTDINETFKLTENAVTSISLSFGGMRNFAQSIRENILDATTGVMALGGELKDVIDIQKGVIKGLQTQTILTKDSFEGLYASGALLNDGQKATAESTKKLASEFVNAGYSIYDVSKQVTGIVNESREQGVVVSAVYNQISTNMDKLALFNFENGVQGMAEMAAKAASLRIDMKGTLDLSEKLFDPEEAIKLSAEMQRLGVNVASLLDPFKLMDLKNDPAKLQEEVLKVAEQYTFFDEKLNKMSILPEGQRAIREIGKVLGYGSEQFAKMAINAGELKIKLQEIKFSADFEGDEEVKNIIANMAQRKDNKYVVTFDEYNKKTGNIETVTKEVSQLTKDNKEALLKSIEPAKSSVELQRSANLSLTNIALDIHAMRSVLPRAVLSSARLATDIDKMGRKAQPFVTAAKKSIGIDVTRRGNGELYTDVTRFNSQIKKFEENGIKFLENLVSGQFVISGITSNIKEMFTNIVDNLKSFPANYNKNLNEVNKEGGGIVDKNKSLSNPVSTVTNPVSTVTNNVPINPISVGPANNDKSNLIPVAVVTDNKQSSPQKIVKGNSDEFNLNLNLKVDPTDLKSTVTTFLSEERFKKQIIQVIENYYSEKSKLLGNYTR